MINWQDRIVRDPKVLLGKPVIKGTRISAEFIIRLLSSGWTRKNILQNYPQLESEDIQAVTYYAADLLTGTLKEVLQKIKPE